MTEASENPGSPMIVGIGASAGGIQALQSFFSHVPDKSGLAYVVILHLSPDYDSQLAHILQTATSMPVAHVTAPTAVKPDHVYVISPNTSLRSVDGMLIVSDLLRMEERRAPIDIFLRTLAEAHGACASSDCADGSTS